MSNDTNEEWQEKFVAFWSASKENAANMDLSAVEEFVSENGGDFDNDTTAELEGLSSPSAVEMARATFFAVEDDRCTLPDDARGICDDWDDDLADLVPIYAEKVFGWGAEEEENEEDTEIIVDTNKESGEEQGNGAEKHSEPKSGNEPPPAGNSEQPAAEKKEKPPTGKTDDWKTVFVSFWKASVEDAAKMDLSSVKKFVSDHAGDLEKTLKVELKGLDVNPKAIIMSVLAVQTVNNKADCNLPADAKAGQEAEDWDNDLEVLVPIFAKKVIDWSGKTTEKRSEAPIIAPDNDPETQTTRDRQRTDKGRRLEDVGTVDLDPAIRVTARRTALENPLWRHGYAIVAATCKVRPENIPALKDYLRGPKARAIYSYTICRDLLRYIDDFESKRSPEELEADWGKPDEPHFPV